MIEFPCWGCGKNLKARDGAGGKKCKCPKCDRENTIPFAAEADPVEVSNEPVARIKPDLLGSEDFQKDQSKSTPTYDFEPVVLQNSIAADFVEYKVREPWYFKEIEYWTYINIGLGMLAFIVIVFLFSSEIAEYYKLTKKISDAVKMAFFLYVWAMLGVFAYIASWAVILVGLDAARNLRGLRHAAFKIANRLEN